MILSLLCLITKLLRNKFKLSPDSTSIIFQPIIKINLALTLFTDDKDNKKTDLAASDLDIKSYLDFSIILM